MEITHKTTAEPAPELEPEPKLNYLQTIWRYRRYMVIELSFFFYVMANLLNSVAFNNFSLEKGCRVNLGYNETICGAMLDKAEWDIDCQNFTDAAYMDQTLLSVDLTGLNYTVCKAENDTQVLSADISGKRAPIGKYHTFIFITN